ncbi:MAG: hypothetical protein HY296_06100 [Thaumarchaeota archaeon]|nr:hypothetical protein [Nitrososphaerota archaeon]
MKNLPSAESNSIKAINSFWKAANYVSVCLLYLRSNPMLLRDLDLTDFKPRALGHWGCVPSINFIWANLLSTIRSTSSDVRLFLGTGHAGASWLACSYLEGSLQNYYGTGIDEKSLAELSASFGRTDGYPTELSALFPGVLWPSGEIGYALGVAHGHALNTKSAISVAVVGDGELETAPTNAALLGIRKFVASPSRLVIIVNLNGLRMGGPSEISNWTDSQIRDYFVGLGLDPWFVEGFNASMLSEKLDAAFRASSRPGGPKVILFRTPKGATIPSSPEGQEIAGTSLSHKVPVKSIIDRDDIDWVEAWLRSYGPDKIFKGAKLDRSRYASILPPKRLLIGTVRDRLKTEHPTLDIQSEKRKALKATMPEAFCEAIEIIAAKYSQGLLLTSPDELASNRLHIRPDHIDIIEYLSEHECLSWSIGAIIAGKPTWFTSYDAFASIVVSMVTQYLKFLDSASKSPVNTQNQPLNVFLTSLAWRNVPSHQDPGFASTLLEKHSDYFRCYLPATPQSMTEIVAKCHRRANLVNCVVADKYPSAWKVPRAGPYNGSPFSRLGKWGARNHKSKVSFVVAGDYLIREAMYASEVIGNAGLEMASEVIVLEELSWLYRSSVGCNALREQFRRVIAGSDTVVLLTSLYEDCLSSLMRVLVDETTHLLVHGFQPSGKQRPPLGVLTDSRSSWVQLTKEVLYLAQSESVRSSKYNSILGSLEKIAHRITNDLDESYDDPAWYWESEPLKLLSLDTKARID